MIADTMIGISFGWLSSSTPVRKVSPPPYEAGV
jgi:hypothetical protein